MSAEELRQLAGAPGADDALGGGGGGGGVLGGGDMPGGVDPSSNMFKDFFDAMPEAERGPAAGPEVAALLSVKLQPWCS